MFKIPRKPVVDAERNAQALETIAKHLTTTELELVAKVAKSSFKGKAIDALKQNEHLFII
jgi:hypothetical protein